MNTVLARRMVCTFRRTLFHAADSVLRVICTMSCWQVWTATYTRFGTTNNRRNVRFSREIIKKSGTVQFSARAYRFRRKFDWKREPNSVAKKRIPFFPGFRGNIDFWYFNRNHQVKKRRYNFYAFVTPFSVRAITNGVVFRCITYSKKRS